MRCEHERDDAAYVLGALPPAEREAFERHMETCAACRASVSEVAGMPGLLARLDPARAQATVTGHPVDDQAAGVGAGDPATVAAGPPPRAPETLLPRILRAAAAEQRRNRRKARWRVVTGSAVAACLAAVVSVGAVTTLQGAEEPPPAPPPVVAMVPLSATYQIGANLTLVDHSWGTEIRMWCKYKGSSPKAGGGDRPRRYRYQLVAITKDGATATLASWAIEAGDREPEVTATTEYHRDQLKQLELQRADGKALLRYVF